MPTTKLEKLDGWVSVTEVLDAFIPKGLLDWYLKTGKKEAKRLSTVAMKIGTRVDELIQEDVLTGSYKLSSKDSIEVKNCMEAWRQFKNDYQPTIQHSQLEVKIDGDKIVGHIDLIFNNLVVDVKCSSSIKPNHWLQTGKYQDMFSGSDIVGKSDIDGVAILRLDKNLGTYQYVNKSIEEAFDYARIFDGLMSAYRYYQPKAEKEE